MSLALRRTSGTSLHRQIFLTLRDEILRGKFAPGSLFATDEELCRTFDVSRITVRRAVSDLVAYGLLEKRQLRTYVAIDASLPRASISFIETMQESIVDTKVSVLSLGLEVPGADIAAQMDWRAGELALRVLRLHSHKRLPLMVVEAWVSRGYKKVLTATLLRKKPLYRLLLESGVVFHRAIEEHTAVVADAPTAALLRTEVGTPLFRITRCLYDDAKRPVQLLVVHVTPERSRVILSVDISGEDMILDAGSVVHDTVKFKL